MHDSVQRGYNIWKTRISANASFPLNNIEDTFLKKPMPIVSANVCFTKKRLPPPPRGATRFRFSFYQIKKKNHEDLQYGSLIFT